MIKTCIQPWTCLVDDEPAAVELMKEYAGQNGFSIDITPERYHHEIYLSDPRKIAPEKLKTVIRYPIGFN